MLRAVSGNTQTPFPTGMNAKGISVSGAYGLYQNPSSSITVAASGRAGYTMNGTVTTSAILDTIPLPANMIGPDGWFDLYVEWSFSNSANVKTLQVVPDHLGTAVTDSQTTGSSSIIRMRIGNQGNTGNNMYPAGPVASGNMSGAPNWCNLDFTQEHSLALWGGLTNTADNITVQRWALTAHNPPVSSSPRLMYGTPIFYGANTHFDDSQSIAMHIAGLKTMGMKLMRMTYEWSGLSTLVSYAQALQTDGTGIQMLCCLDLGIGGYATEALAYAATVAAVQPVVQALAAVGVRLFECGNEMDTKLGINTGDPQGGLPSDYSAALVPIFRGVQRGAIDAVHSVPGCLAGSNAYTVCSIALSDMMHDGTNTDGSKASTGPMRWDWTSWHNYEDYGPLVGVELGNSRRWVNVYEYLNRRYGVPIIISEWNGKASDTDAQRASWASRFMYEALANKYKYNIAAWIVYEMYGSPWQVLDPVANTPISTFGTTVQSFITANPDTGT